ncbi:DUF1828 domain-containing protein [Lactobacillus rizhaonensis]|uniref:DUF1828 domain-containing protein n=2 Tax=Lactobacillus TaxID=1578 RepID=UPI0030C7547B
MIGKNADLNEFKNTLQLWVNNHTHVLLMDQNTLEVETIYRDSFNESVYCFVEITAKEKFIVSDDGRSLFKLDPSASDVDLIATIGDISLASEFDFNLQNGVISAKADRQNLIDTIMRLAQLQVNISYLN